MPQDLRRLAVARLTREAFHRFGDVLDVSGPADDVANGGAARIYRDRAKADFDADGGRVCFNVVRTAPRQLPLKIELLERHALSSQTFSPLSAAEWLVVVAPAGQLDPDAIVAFRVLPGQAINYRRGVWHHPLDRAGEGERLSSD